MYVPINNVIGWSWSCYKYMNTSLLQGTFFFFWRKTLPGTWWLTMPLTQRLWDNLCTYHFHTNVCVFWSTRNPYDNLLQKKKIHMIRTSLYIYVIKCMALKRVINLFDCFNFFFLSLFFTFHFHLKPVQLPQILEDLTKLASD